MCLFLTLVFYYKILNMIATEPYGAFCYGALLLGVTRITDADLMEVIGNGKQPCLLGMKA